MKNKTFNCSCCNSNFTAFVAEAIVNAICPTCGKIARLMQTGVNLGLTYNQAFGAVIVGFIVYEIYNSSKG